MITKIITATTIVVLMGGNFYFYKAHQDEILNRQNCQKELELTKRNLEAYSDALRSGFENIKPRLD